MSVKQNEHGRHLDDIENARRFASEHAGRACFVLEEGAWRIYDRATGTWKADPDGVLVQQLGKQTARGWFRDVARDEKDEGLLRHALRSNSRNKIAAMIDLARGEPELVVSIAKFDRNSFLLNCANGIVNLQTGELSPHDPGKHLTKSTGVRYDPHAPASRWERFLREVFDNDEDLIAFVQRLAGYFLTGDVREHIAPIAEGSGCNGKSIFVGTLLAAMGNYGHRADSSLLLQSPQARRSDQASPEIAALRGVRLAVCSETGHGRKLNEPLVKELTGGDRLSARPLYCNPISFDPTHKLLLVTNCLPHTTDDPALWRRLRRVPFHVAFLGREDKRLEATLRGELPGILRWAVAGAAAWLQHGLAEPESVRLATDEYRRSEDVVAAFLAECCERDESSRVAAGTLYDNFKQWAEGSGEHVFSMTAFGRRLGEMGFAKEGNRPVYRRGLRLRHVDSCDSLHASCESPNARPIGAVLNAPWGATVETVAQGDWPAEREAIQNEH